jgi:hypothetical protein
MAVIDSTELKVDVEVLKRDVDTLTKLCEKMDTVIEKLVDHQGVLIGQIYKDMDKREDDTNEDIKDLHSRITTTSRELSDKVESTERKIMEQIEKLSLQIQAHNAKEDSELEKILQWKWTIVGGILVLSWLTSHVGLDTIIKLIH